MSDMSQALRDAIAKALPDANVVVTAGSSGHYSLEVTSTAFAGKNMLQSQRLVYSAIKELMAGSGAPVHAIDSLRTNTP
jgi:stress-induced morphogen